MKVNKYFEFVQADLEPIKSFYIKDELNPKLWDNFELDGEVREQLIKIAQDFYESTELKADVKDIILTGSLANYNWSEKYSDYDLHILIDFDDVDDNVELVKKFADAAKKNKTMETQAQKKKNTKPAKGSTKGSTLKNPKPTASPSTGRYKRNP
jgi:hypothetical protein